MYVSERLLREYVDHIIIRRDNIKKAAIRADDVETVMQFNAQEATLSSVIDELQGLINSARPTNRLIEAE